jgi:kynurenine formamidase
MCVPGTLETVRDRAERGHVHRIDRRGALLAGAGAALAAALPGAAAAAKPAKAANNKLQDLTYVFREGFPGFLGAPTIIDRQAVVTIPVNGFYGQHWTFWEHSCTHMDVPGHFVAGGRLAPDLDLDELIRPLVVIDIRAKAASDPDAVVTVDDVRSFERGHGRIPRGAVLAMWSGWQSRVASEAEYRNVGADGLQHFPGWDADAAEWAMEERDAAGFGVDTLSLDPGNSTTFDAHLTILAADRYGIENLANLGSVPERGATVTVGLVPWEAGSGGPGRVFASW